MLKHIPPILSPQLLTVLARMGHGDELVLADGNFPAESRGREVVRADGHGVPALLEAILQLLPLDTFVAEPAIVMQPVDTSDREPPVWDEYRRIISAAEGREIPLAPLERFAFYERAGRAFAIVATSETALYGNLILKKGVIAI